MFVCIYSVFVQVAVLRLADPPSKESNDYFLIKKLKWNKAFHGCPMFQKLEQQERKTDRERESLLLDVIFAAQE
jgi:hypothetical protein